MIDGDSVLSEAFIDKLCEAARYPDGDSPGVFELEKLILQASGANQSDTLSYIKTNDWYNRYGSTAFCISAEGFPEGNFLRQIIHSNFRDFANLIGPKRALELNVLKKTDADSLSLYEYTNTMRKNIESQHDNRRFEFQQDENWRNIMFFYFLFSEYKINYEQNLAK